MLATLVAAASSDHPAPPGLLSPEISLIVWTWVTFGLLLWVLSKFAWGPIQKLLQERAAKIEGEIDRARRLREEAEARVAEYTERMDKIREEVEKLRDEGRAQGEELKKQIEAAARKEAAEIRERASREVELMVTKARAELRAEVVNLALQAAESVTRKSLTGEDHKRYADEAIARIGNVRGKN